MKVLVLGHRGQLAAALRAAAPQCCDVHSMGSEQLDLAYPEAVAPALEALGPQVVINAAAHTAVDQAEDEPELAARINGEAPARIARWCAENGARLLHVSTDFVFDGSRGRPWRPDDEPRPLGVYGQSKRSGELGVLEAGRADFVVLRTAWVYSAGGRNFALTMLRLMRERERVEVVSDQIGTPTHAASLARALWRFVECPEVGGIHHWTDAGVASWYDFAMAIMEEGMRLGLLDREIPVHPVSASAFERKAPRPAFSVLDKTDTVAALGMGPNHWRAELRQMLGTLETL